MKYFLAMGAGDCYTVHMAIYVLRAPGLGDDMMSSVTAFLTRTEKH